MPDWTLHHGDCIAGMASLLDQSVDVVITDPPYSKHVHSNLRRGVSSRRVAIGSRAVDLGFVHLTDDVRAATAEHIARVVQRWVLIFSDLEGAHLWREELERNGLEYVRQMTWHKLASTPQFTGDRPASHCEAIVLAHQPGRKHWNGGGRGDHYEMPIARTEGTRAHPTQKPLALMEALVRDFTEPGELVADPFAGSGTTGVAALRLGRRFIGWELDEKYHAAASKRLSVTREQTEMNL